MLPLTQEALSQMLGVRRTTVTLLMRNLRASGGIRSDRRGLIEIDRSRLAAMACECHRGCVTNSRRYFSSGMTRSCVLPMMQ
ncbi:helix-turn-helix domain-containing protein [Bradyrhizobium elkanii]|uniref:helix-turn-helix domain-containing protein n=1 Tax=Bradyrhizobium elkanii TaxID=29448 RepID=UPI002012B7A2|nr:helix-turn-helix domain-containing protein [Bradyrhizobium elkanii]